MLEEIEYKSKRYLKLQSEGFASQFAIPFALKFCTGVGYDIGFAKEEWKLPNAIGIDLCLNNGFTANTLPEEKVDYIYSSHCLEHLDNWVDTLEYWTSKLKSKGILFLYLPHPDQEYWLPWNNKKHKHVLFPDTVVKCMEHLGFKKIHASQKDLNYSYMVVGELN